MVQLNIFNSIAMQLQRHGPPSNILNYAQWVMLDPNNDF